jgi:Sulfatase
MKALKRTVGLLYPLCFGLAPILSLYTLNRAEVQPQELLRPLCMTLVGALGALLGFYALSRRSGERAALALSVLLTAFFAYGLLEAPLDSTFRLVFALLYPPLLDLSIAHRALILYGFGLCILLGLVLWGRYEPRHLRIPAWVMGLGYLVPVLFALVRPVPLVPLLGSEPPRAASQAALTDPKTPDLYCIVLDAYGRQDQLQALFSFDNTPFLQALEQRGFRVLTKSRANYIQTVLCVASLLNLDYLPNDPQAEGVDQAVRWIQTGRLMARMKARGYQIVNIPCDFSPTILKGADVRLSELGPVTSDRSPFERLLLGRTPFAYTLLGDHPAYDGHRAQILASLGHIPEAARLPGPKFVFVHVLAPHPPFVLDSAGGAIYPDKAQYSIGDATDFGKNNTDSYRTGYIGQLRAVNTKVLEALDSLQKNSTRPAVIVVLGDHGSRMQTDWKSRERTNVQEAFSNLQAVFVPGGAPYLTDDLTPLNTFRLLLTHVYGESLPRLPDRSYYSTLQNPLKFEEVTAKLQ